MLRLFLIGLFVSLVALAGAYYWRTYHPQLIVKERVIGPPGAERPFETLRNKARSSAKTLAERGRIVLKRVPSDIQTWATIFSLVSSVFTALGALLSGYFTWMRYRSERASMAVRSQD